MHSMLLLGVVALCACGRFGFDEVVSCVDGTCSGTSDANEDLLDAPRGMPGVDTDSDSVTDDIDNCMLVENPTQHDEDTDGYGDICDNCPTVANTSQANVGETNAGTTADSLGDACDPRPGGAGDTVLTFDPFVGTMLSPDWSVVTGTWIVGGDAVSQPNLTSDQRIHDPAVGVGPNYIVETSLTFTGFDAGNVNAGILFRMTNDNGWLCAVFRDDSVAPVDSVLAIWSIQNGAANFERAATMITEPKMGDRFRILAGGFGSNLKCSLESLQTGPSAPFTSNQNNDGFPGMRMNRTSGTYSYFIVYGLGGAL